MKKPPKDVIDIVESYIPDNFNNLEHRFNLDFWREFIDSMSLKTVQLILAYPQQGNWNPFMYYHAQCRVAESTGVPREFPATMKLLRNMLYRMLEDRNYCFGEPEEIDKYIEYYRRYRGDGEVQKVSSCDAVKEDDIPIADGD